MKVKNTLRKIYANIRGQRYQKKLLVIESDDWGSVRLHDKKAVDSLQKRRVPLQNNKFTVTDGLERKEDLENLFEVLTKFKDINDNPAVLTPLSLVANPFFDEIRRNSFTNYEFQNLNQTYDRYNEQGLLQLWIEEGIKNNLFYPQFHGREHINSYRWMRALQNQEGIARKGFERDSILGLKAEKENQADNYMAAFEAINAEEQKSVNNMIKEGLILFKSTFGFSSRSVMPSQSIISEDSKICLKQYGVDYMQCGQHFIPYEKRVNKVNYWWGHRDAHGLTYWRRNCTFEPYKNAHHDHVNQCLKEIAIAFKCGKPAVISSHRINYTSRISPDIRDRALNDLKALLEAIVKKWPTVKFVNSSQLANLMDEKKSIV